MGYEKIRETILANQKKMGILPASTELSPMNPLADLKSVDGKPFRPSTGASLGLALRRRKEALRPHGRGLRRLLHLTDHETGR